MALDPRCFAVGDSIPHGLGFDNGLTAAKDTMFKNSGAGEVCGWRKWSNDILGASVKRSDTGQEKSEVKALRMVHMFCTWWKVFFRAALRRNLRDQPFHWNDSFHGYITGRRREGAMITQRAVSVRLQKEGI